MRTNKSARSHLDMISIFFCLFVRKCKVKQVVSVLLFLTEY